MAVFFKFPILSLATCKLSLLYTEDVHHNFVQDDQELLGLHIEFRQTLLSIDYE